MDTALQPAMVEADLGFSRPAEVVDDDGSRGLKRAVTRPVDQDFSSQFEYRRCQIRDLCGAGHPQPGLRSMGFETIDLRDREDLQSLLCDIRSPGRSARLSPDSCGVICRAVYFRCPAVGA